MALSLMKFAEALKEELKKNPDLIVGDEFVFRSEDPDYIGLPISYQVQKDWGGLYRLHGYYKDYVSGEKTIEQIAAAIAEIAKTYKVEKKIDLFDFEAIKPYLTLLVRGNNFEREQLVFKQVEDLKLICAVMLPGEFIGRPDVPYSCVYVISPLLEKWGKAFDEVLEVSMHNSVENDPPKLFGSTVEPNAKEFSLDCGIILSTMHKSEGAIALFYPGIMEWLNKEIFHGNGFVAIPITNNEFYLFRHDYYLSTEQTAKLQSIAEQLADPDTMLISTNRYRYTAEDGLQTIKETLEIG